MDKQTQDSIKLLKKHNIHLNEIVGPFNMSQYNFYKTSGIGQRDSIDITGYHSYIEDALDVALEYLENTLKNTAKE